MKWEKRGNTILQPLDRNFNNICTSAHIKPCLEGTNCLIVTPISLPTVREGHSPCGNEGRDEH